MGKVKKKLPTPDKNPVDGDKLIESTKPRKVTVEELIIQLNKDIDAIGSWVVDLDKDLAEQEKLLTRIAERMGLK